MPKGTCGIEGCEKPRYARSWCYGHYKRWLRHGSPFAGGRPRLAGSVCIVDGCELPRYARGWCSRHYGRWERHGDPLGGDSLRGCDPAERFWAKVNKDGPIPEHRPDLGPCWVWTGRRNSEDYGRLSVEGHGERAHRFGYALLVGPIPTGLVLDHLCRNTLCVNPAHLEPVTDRVNVLRGIGPTAQHARATHCVRGHPLSGANLYLNPEGERRCRICKREDDRRYKARRRAA
jgi:HNH endonuclease